MKKYREAFVIAFKTRSTYRFDTAMQVFSGIARVLFAWLLWAAIYKGRYQVAGFTLDTMILYYLIQSFFAQMDNTGLIAEELSSHIRAGTFSKFLVLPIKVQPYLYAQNLGSAAYMAFFSVAASALSLLVFPIKPEWTMLPLNWAKAFVLLLLGRLFLAQMNFFLGVLTIKYQDIWLFLMIKNNIQAFLAGALVPLTLMPDAVLKALRLTPFYHATHLPAMLLLGRNNNEALTGMLVLILWIAIFMALNKYAYTHLRTRYDGVGI